jgi:hypothetical protein
VRLVTPEAHPHSHIAGCATVAQQRTSSYCDVPPDIYNVRGISVFPIFDHFNPLSGKTSNRKHNYGAFPTVEHHGRQQATAHNTIEAHYVVTRDWSESMNKSCPVHMLGALHRIITANFMHFRI